MNIVLFDETSAWENLLPLTFTKPISKLRIGILTIDEKWKLYFPKSSINFLSQDYLSSCFACEIINSNTFINATILPNESLVSQISTLKDGEGLSGLKGLVAFKGSQEAFNAFKLSEAKKVNGMVDNIEKVYELFQKNGTALISDYELITKNRKSKALSSSVTVIGSKDLVFLEEGAKAEACIFNTKAGPIYIGKDAEVMEGSMIRGPFALGEHSALKLGTKIYGPTTVGPHCKVGGEVNNSVIFGYSNKAHDGFLGNSVIGEWCNLGADTNNSNLKNNYGNVKLYNYKEKKSTNTGLQFCGLIMGDYSKSGISTMFNTGTVVGVAANIFGSGFPVNHIPSFSWGSAEGMETYSIEKLFETSEKVFERRGLTFGVKEKEMLKEIFDYTQLDRLG